MHIADARPAGRRPAEVAAATGLSCDSIYRAIRDGRLPAARIGRRALVVSDDAMRAWIAPTNAAPQAQPEPLA